MNLAHNGLDGRPKQTIEDWIKNTVNVQVLKCRAVLVTYGGLRDEL